MSAVFENTIFKLYSLQPIFGHVVDHRISIGFGREFQGFDDRVQDEILAKLIVLETEGPNLGRPHADTLNGSAHSNMKELRVRAAGGIWRIAFAFYLGRNAILLAAGDKRGANEDRFYRDLIRLADSRFADHLAA